MESIYLAGPTASGKSAVALELAERLSGEIISVDSVQVYRGMDIGTAKPSAGERARVPHYLIDVVDLRKEFDAAQFMQLASAAAADILGRGRRPIFCGGTGFYFNALLGGLDEMPRGDAALRKELENAPLELLLEELRSADPDTYEQLDRQNRRRVLRAVEIWRASGRRPSELRKKQSKPTARHLIVIERTVDDLQARIRERVDAMFAAGLVEETRALLSAGLAQNRIAALSLGYRQVLEHLEGRHTLPETIQLVKLRTRQYAKKQFTWFGRQLVAQFLPVEGDKTPEAIASRIQSLVD